jgi:hypothetical protein
VSVGGLAAEDLQALIIRILTLVLAARVLQAKVKLAAEGATEPAAAATPIAAVVAAASPTRAVPQAAAAAAAAAMV